MVADIEELEKMDASEIHSKRLNAKVVLTPMNGEQFLFPIADGTVELSEGDPVLRTFTLIRDRPDRGEEQGNLQGESDGSSSTPFRDSSPDEKIVAKLKPTLNLASPVSTNPSTVHSPIASKSSGILNAPWSKLISQVQGNLTQENIIKTQRRVLKVGKKMQCWTRVRGHS